MTNNERERKRLAISEKHKARREQAQQELAQISGEIPDVSAPRADYYYAFLNADDIVESIITLPTSIDHPQYIQIPTYDESLIGKKYNRETGQFEDVVVTTPLKYATFVIGTTLSGHTKDDVNFLCTGVDDHKQFNLALNNLPATGGKIIIREGTYKIGTGINPIEKPNVTIEGMGSSTILDRNQGLNPGAYVGALTVSSNNVKIRGINMRGSGTSDGKPGILVDYAKYCSIEGCEFTNFWDAISFINSTSGTVINNRFLTTAYLQIIENSEGISTTSNYFEGRSTGYYAIDSENLTVTNNVYQGCTDAMRIEASTNVAITGNVTRNCTFSSLYLENVAGGSVTGHSSYADQSGIRLQGSCSRLVISGNSIARSNSFPIFTSSASSNNLIIGNNIYGTNLTNNGTNNTLANNKYN